ncbi:MAG: hypothetical protein Rubg2KO_19040 [Rubricoccaceae bacterium]
MSNRPSPRLPVPVERSVPTTRPATRAGDASHKSSTALKAELAARERDVAYRLTALKEEITAPFGGLVGGARSLASKPKPSPERLLLIAGAVGATAGILLGLRSRRKRRPEPDAGFDFIQARLSTFLDDAAAKVAKGRSAEDALDDLFRTVPVVYADRQLAADALESKPSAVKTLAKSAAGFGLKMGIDMVKKSLAGKQDALRAEAHP